MCLKSVLTSVLHMRRTKSPIVAPHDPHAHAHILDNNNTKQEDAEMVQELEKLLLHKLSSPNLSGSDTGGGQTGQNGMVKGPNPGPSPEPEANSRKSAISTISGKLGITDMPDRVPTPSPSVPQSAQSIHSNGRPMVLTVTPKLPQKPNMDQVLLTSSDNGNGPPDHSQTPDEMDGHDEPLHEEEVGGRSSAHNPFSAKAARRSPPRPREEVHIVQSESHEKREGSAPKVNGVHHEREGRIPSIAEQCRHFESKVNQLERIAGPAITTHGKSKGKTVVPKKVYKGSFKESNNNSNGTAGAAAPTADKVVFASDLKPLDSPKSALTQALANLNTNNWETNIEGFKLLVRLVRFHPEFLHPDLHQINLIGLKHLSNLRSQVARSACLFFKEMFEKLGKLMEQDVEQISEKLLDKSADTNKFIREDAASALESMVQHVSPAKAFASLDPHGTKHKNAIVRSTTSRMTSIAVDKVGAEKCLNELGDRILPMLVSFVQEGSLETRMKGKAALSVLAAHPDFDYHLKTHITPEALRHVTKCIASVKSEVQGRSY